MTVMVKNRLRLLTTLFLLAWQLVSHGQLRADFTAPLTAGCSPLVVNFSNTSTGATQWQWDLGNGTASVLQNPSATYFAPGTYAVKLVVRNAAGNADSITKTDYITVFPPPVAALTADRTRGCFPLAVGFTDGSAPGTGTVTAWFWDFGDGNTSQLPNPRHVYRTAGLFTVTLRVTNSAGCSNTVSYRDHIQVAEGVKAAFSNSSPSACSAPAAVQFTNASTGPGPLRFEWRFGDGATSAATNPLHTYVADGAYTASLVAISPQGCTDTVTQTGSIRIGEGRASFTVPDTLCVNRPTLFTSTASPAPRDVKWLFGNGQTSTTVNATTTYTQPGRYPVKLVADFGGCIDSAEKEVVVVPALSPAFSADKQVFCAVPATVQFSHTATGAHTVRWEFGDGTSSTDPAPKHSYTRAGNYTVKLVVTNSAGCTDSVEVTDFIRISVPQVTVNGLPRNGCVPLAITPSASVLSNHQIASYRWSFGDGATATGLTTSHSYSRSGTYTVTLVYTTTEGCTDSVVLRDAVRVGNKPQANFSVTPTDRCAYEVLQFTDRSTGNPDQWHWTFNDGGISTEQSPEYAYSDTGWYDVRLIVYNNTCPDTIILRDIVHIRPPVATYRVQYDCNDKYTKTFVDGSIGAKTWFWNFGDGSTSTQQHPVHRFAAPGAYAVTLTVTNDQCSNTFVQTVHVVDERARFLATDDTLCRNTRLDLASVGIDSANIASWLWQFGDGATAVTDSFAAHTYTASGRYTVSLSITDRLGCTSATWLPVTVHGAKADFAVSAPVACLDGNRTTFTDRSTTDGTHSLQSWQWRFGDGGVDLNSGSSVLHHYAAAGAYDVMLVVKDAFGCTDSVTKPAAVVIAQPKAAFFSADTLWCTGKPVAFTNQSTGIGLQASWLFGDNNRSSDFHPQHQYAAVGTYDVQLAVQDQYGCTDTATKPAYITVSFPKARFTLSDSVSTCPPLLVNFSQEATDFTSLHWDFGDGTSSNLAAPSRFYTSAGTYQVRLTATGPGGCTDVATKTIVIKGPSGSFSYTPLNGCVPLTVNFTATTKNNARFTWDFADGTIQQTTEPFISHTYTTPGAFVPKMILTDPAGCSVPITGTDTIRVSGIRANFAQSRQRLCDNGSVSFTNTTTGNDRITSYFWQFGDGTTSNAAAPTHHFTTPGQYTVSLLAVSQNGCRDSLKLVDAVTVHGRPAIDFTLSPSGCTPLTASFQSQVTGGNAGALQWSWNFGNGATATTAQPASQPYTLAGTYTVTAIATDENGCRDTAARSITAFPVPVVNAGLDTSVCLGSAVPLTATGADTYLWKESPGLSCSSCPSPLVAPANDSWYVVTGTTRHGCTATDSVRVSVHHPFVLSVGRGDTVCAGNTVHLRASGADRYTWFPATAVANTAAGITTANPTTTTTYTVVARDNAACFADTGYVHIKVWPYPTVNLGPDRTVIVGSTVALQPVYSADITSYLWTNPMQTLSCTTCPAPVVQARGERNTYRVQVKNDGGCTAADEVTIYAICNNGNLFIPNTFSPNADGKNERFYPRGTGLTSVRSLRIYNRWGEIVFSRNDFNANDAASGWDGTFKGKPLPPDVYVYTCEVVCVNNELLLYHGNVTLLR